METFFVTLSDERTDLALRQTETTPYVWGYEVEANGATDAANRAIKLWHADAGERMVVSLYVVPGWKKPEGVLTPGTSQE